MNEQLQNKLVKDLIENGCKDLTIGNANELAKNILNNKLNAFNIDNESSYEERVDIQSESNKSAVIDAMSKFIPEKLSDSDAVKLEVKHWRMSFISACLCSGKSVAKSIKDANDAISSVYGGLDFDL